ncbi:MAG: flagellar hook-associated protein FlgK [Spirochaetia bacterium]|nr:flagellar hook-associated protein FlgK [Spirochaetia bacterium]
MQSSFAGIELGKKSIIAHSKAVGTVGHNISNAGVEGYSRQRVRMEATEPLYFPHLNRENTPGQIGQGVDAVWVERIEDELMEGRIVGRMARDGYWGVRDQYLLQVERIYNEPDEISGRVLMDQFWTSWQQLVKNPESMAVRDTVRERGAALIDNIHENYNQLKTVRNMLNTEVQTAVNRINEILDNVAELNKEIARVEGIGDRPNDLYDKRDVLVRELGSYINVSTNGQDPDEFNVHTGGRHLLQGKIAFHLETVSDPANEGYLRVTWVENGEDVQMAGGKLKSYMDLRDVDLRREIAKLDQMTVNFIDLVNENHRKAYNLQGETGVDFFTEYPFVNNVDGNFDSDGDGAMDQTRLFRITGSNILQPQEQIGLQGTLTFAAGEGTVNVDYYPTDTVETLVRRINTSGSEVVARLDSDGRLQLRAVTAADRNNPDFVIRYAADSGEFLTNYSGVLAASGEAGAYNWEQADAVTALRSDMYATSPLAHPAGWIEVNSVIAADVTKIAAGWGVNGRPAELGDGRGAQAIANIRNNEVMVGRLKSFDAFFAERIADIGVRGAVARDTAENERLVLKELNDMKLAVTGVNIDEEFTEMLKFQHGYSAAARFVNEIDKMLDIIINRIGV